MNYPFSDIGHKENAISFLHGGEKEDSCGLKSFFYGRKLAHNFSLEKKEPQISIPF